MIDTKFRMTRTAWLLLALMMTELGLVAALRRLGWFGTGNLLQLLGSIFVIAIPFLLIGLMLFRDRFRMSLKGLLITVALFAVFMAINVKPLIDYRELRAGSMALLESEASLHCEKYEMGGDGRQRRVVHEAPQVWLPPWLTYFSREWSKAPCDETVIQIDIAQTQSIKIVADNAARFKRLERLWINTLVSDVNEIKLLPEIFAEYPSLRFLGIAGDQAMLVEILPKCENLSGLAIYSTPVDENVLADIARCKSLSSLSFFHTNLDDEMLEKLSSLTTLKNLSVNQSDITAEGVELFRKSNPACQFHTDVFVDTEPELTSPKK